MLPGMRRSIPNHGPIVHVVGARPQFVKAAAVFAAVEQRDRHRLLHTGQHYDEALSDVFFRELGLPPPDVHLGVGSGRHGAQTAAMLAGIETALLAMEPGVLVVYGDTNSTAAAALAAAKLHWPVVHIEAGLRSFDRRMPEEINRVVADHLGDVLLCPTQAAADQLAREGITEGVIVSGDVMLDIFRDQSARARRETPVGRWLAEGGSAPAPLDALPDTLRPGKYALTTIHRADTTDEPQRLAALVAALGEVGRPVLWPVHPRTRKAMEAARICPPESVWCIEPVGYLTFLALLLDAAIVLTDSGGVQREAFFAGRPCVTLRDTSEWPETTTGGWNRLVGVSAAALVDAARRPPPTEPPAVELFGDGRAAVRIAHVIEGSGAGA